MSGDVTQGWHEFVMIVDAGSISEAARRLNVPRATLSRQLSALEARLGTRLLHRSTRQMALTQEGEMLHEKAQVILEEAQALSDALRATHEPQGHLKVSTPPLSGNMEDLFLEFMDRYPKIKLELHQSARFVDLIQGRFDVALRAGQSTQKDVIMRHLYSGETIVVASPSYLERCAHPLNVAQDLALHPCVVGFGGGEGPVTHWPVWGSEQMVKVSGTFASADLLLRRRVVEQGKGVGLLPKIACKSLINEGGLVQVLRGVVGRVNQLSLVYPERRYLPTKVRVFVDHAVAWFGQREIEMK